MKNKTDVLVKLAPDNTYHRLIVLYKNWSGRIVSGCSKDFETPFHARNLESEVADCNTWKRLTPTELEEAKRIAKKGRQV